MMTELNPRVAAEGEVAPTPHLRGDTSISATNPFSALGLSKKVVRPLAVLGLKEPTPIQKRAIPLVLEGRDEIPEGFRVEDNF